MLVEPRAMTEDELIERMAREMAGALGARVPYDMLPEDASQPRLADGSRLTKEVLLDGARAALAAIREAGPASVEVPAMEQPELDEVIAIAAACGGYDKAIWALLLLFGEAYQAAGSAINAGRKEYEIPLLDALCDPLTALKEGRHLHGPDWLSASPLKGET
jgi:hypothetical protein